MVTIDEALRKVDFAGLLSQHRKGNDKMKTKKVVEKKAVKKVVRDDFGFARGSKSSQAVKALLVDGKPMKDVRKKFPSLSYGRLLNDLKGRGFKVKKDSQGLCTVVGA